MLGRRVGGHTGRGAHAGPDLVAVWHALLLLLVVLVCVSLVSFSHLQRPFLVVGW